MKIYSETELRGKTKLGLRSICQEVGVTFGNDKSCDQLVEAILGVQQKVQERLPATGEAKPKKNKEPAEGIGHVRVTSGATSQTFQIAGTTIKSALGDLRGLINIDPEAKPFVNGAEAQMNYTLQDGDHLEMVKKSGDKASF